MSKTALALVACAVWILAWFPLSAPGADGPATSGPSAGGPTTSRPASSPALSTRDRLIRYQTLQQDLVQLFGQKKYEEAEKVCRQIIELAPSQPDTYYNLACALARQGKKEEAVSALKRALELGQAEPEHMKVDEDLVSLHDDSRWPMLVKAAQDNVAKSDAEFPLDKGADMPGVKTLEGTADGGLRYRLRIDPNATKDRPARLVVWLHPSGGYANNAAESLLPVFLRHGYALLVFTQKEPRFWSGPDFERAMKTVQAVGKTEGLDANRPVLLGFSAGGQAALNGWSDKPGEFGGLVLDASYPIDAAAYSQGRVTTMAVPKDEAVKSVPIFAVVGEADNGSQLWRSVHAKWQKAGVPLSVQYVPNGKHQWLFNKSVTEALDKWLAEVAAGRKPQNQPTSAPASSGPASRPARTEPLWG